MVQLRECSAFPINISTSYSTDTVGPVAEKYHVTYHFLHHHIMVIKKVTLLRVVLLWCGVLAFSNSNTSVPLATCPTQWWTRETEIRDWSRKIYRVELEAKKKKQHRRGLRFRILLSLSLAEDRDLMAEVAMLDSGCPTKRAQISSTASVIG